jgi:hypothetical protein
MLSRYCFFPFSERLFQYFLMAASHPIVYGLRRVLFLNSPIRTLERMSVLHDPLHAPSLMNDLQVAGGVSSLPPPYVPDSESGVWHRFPLQDKRGKQWGVLAFQSGARKTTSIPLFYEDDTIHGSFETDVDKGDSMRSVTVKVRLALRFWSWYLTPCPA